MPIVKMPDGGHAIVCRGGGGGRRTPCDYCEKVHIKLCDWPIEGARTCDKKLCKDHAHEVGPDRDYCPEHFEVILAQGKPNV